MEKPDLLTKKLIFFFVGNTLLTLFYTISKSQWQLNTSLLLLVALAVFALIFSCLILKELWKLANQKKQKTLMLLPFLGLLLPLVTVYLISRVTNKGMLSKQRLIGEALIFSTSLALILALLTPLIGQHQKQQSFWFRWLAFQSGPGLTYIAKFKQETKQLEVFKHSIRMSCKNQSKELSQCAFEQIKANIQTQGITSTSAILYIALEASFGFQQRQKTPRNLPPHEQQRLAATIASQMILHNYELLGLTCSRTQPHQLSFLGGILSPLELVILEFIDDIVITKLLKTALPKLSEMSRNLRRRRMLVDSEKIEAAVERFRFDPCRIYYGQLAQLLKL